MSTDIQFVHWGWYSVVNTALISVRIQLKCEADSPKYVHFYTHTHTCFNYMCLTFQWSLIFRMKNRILQGNPLRYIYVNTWKAIEAKPNLPVIILTFSRSSDSVGHCIATSFPLMPVKVRQNIWKLSGFVTIYYHLLISSDDI